MSEVILISLCAILLIKDVLTRREVKKLLKIREEERENIKKEREHYYKRGFSDGKYSKD